MPVLLALLSKMADSAYPEAWNAAGPYQTGRVVVIVPVTVAILWGPGEAGSSPGSWASSPFPQLLTTAMVLLGFTYIQLFPFKASFYRCQVLPVSSLP